MRSTSRESKNPGLAEWRSIFRANLSFAKKVTLWRYAGACLAFPRQQPFNSLRKLPTDPKQDLRPNLHLPSFHRR
jgi:hypothetical protein